MHHVLVVDNSLEDFREIDALLSGRDEFALTHARDAASAWDCLRAGLVPIDAVLLDVTIPGLFDHQLIDRARELHPRLPLLIVSTKGYADLAIRALQQGASSYVPKDALADDLLTTLRDLLEYSKLQDCRKRMMAQMVELHCKFVLENDRALIPPLVGYLQEHLERVGICGQADLTRVGIALDEALANALYHGNLEVQSALREDGDAYYRLAEQRRHEPPYCHRRLFIEVLINFDVAEIVIQDQGPGFDPTGLPDPRDPANLDKVSGRGVLLMRTFMDEVQFSPQGNGVTLRKYRTPEGRPSTSP